MIQLKVIIQERNKFNLSDNHLRKSAVSAGNSLFSPQITQIGADYLLHLKSLAGLFMTEDPKSHECQKTIKQ